MFRQPSPAPRVNLDQVFGTDPLPGDGQPSADPAPGTAHFAHFAHFQQSLRVTEEKTEKKGGSKNEVLNVVYRNTTGGSAQSAQSAQEIPRGIFCASRSDLDLIAADLTGTYRKRELGGITFRLRQTSKNFGTYRFYREGDGELPI